VPARRWTDEQLRHAIATSTTWVEVCAALGLSRSGSVSASLRRRCDELGVDHHHVGNRRRWTDEDLTAAVAGATNMRQVFLVLGLAVGGGTWQAMQDHIRRLGLDTSHWDRPIQDGRRAQQRFVATWSEEDLREACRSARSVAQVMERLGLDPRRKRGRNAVERAMREVGLDPRSLAGQGWSQGTSRAPRYRKTLSEILVADRLIHSTHKLKLRLVEQGVLGWRCAICGIEDWRGCPLSLQLDHINGDRRDNRQENLRLLCPNCHSQTDTFAGRNVGKG
jgi:hypothetical protein